MSDAYDANNVFVKVLRREIPADVVYEDERCLAFRDIAPQAPTHALVIPKKPIVKLGDTDADDRELLGHLLWAAGEVARTLGIGDAFRVVINNGADAGQTVFHLHLHVLGGRNFEWPPG
ncbi:MAG: histidine triad nucleotide-binding protein [Planctomycetota bacterium]